MHALAALFGILACLQVCSVHAVISLTIEAQFAFIVECRDVVHDDTMHCLDGLDALFVLDEDATIFLDTMGFYVPDYQGDDYKPLFWSSYGLGDDMQLIISKLSTTDPSLWSSYSLVPGAIANELYKSPYFPADDVFSTQQFWIPFSIWMAENSEGLALFASGSADNVFPYADPDAEYKTIFETFELPNLSPDKVIGLVALHIPPPNTTPIPCKDDIVSFEHFTEVNPSIQYYCCDLPTFESPEETANEISNIAIEVGQAIDNGTPLPDECFKYGGRS